MTERRCRGELGGATTLSLVILTPVALALALAAFQAALWNHARTEARVVARDVASLVGRSGTPVDVATQQAEAALVGHDLLSGAEVSVTNANGIVTVTISGDAPGIILGTTADVTVVESVALEGSAP